MFTEFKDPDIDIRQTQLQKVHRKIQSLKSILSSIDVDIPPLQKEKLTLLGLEGLLIRPSFTRHCQYKTKHRLRQLRKYQGELQGLVNRNRSKIDEARMTSKSQSMCREETLSTLNWVWAFEGDNTSYTSPYLRILDVLSPFLGAYDSLLELDPSEVYENVHCNAQDALLLKIGEALGVPSETMKGVLSCDIEFDDSVHGVR